MSSRLATAADAVSGEAAALVHAQRNATWSTHLVAALVANGVGDAVVSPGSRNTPLVLALDAALGQRTHVVLDERSAGFVALGLARASGHPVVMVCTSGSAATHYFPAIVEAHYSHIPLLVVSADRPPELHHNGAGQTIEQDRLYGDYVRWAAALGVPSAEADPRSWGQMAARAVALATGARSGPVHLNVSFREPLWAPGVGYGAPGRAALAIQQRGTVHADLAELEARIAKARRGVIVCGPRASGSTLAADVSFAHAVVALGARLGWPVLADAISGVRNVDGVITTYDSLLRTSSFADGVRPDLVLRFGQLPASKPLAAWLGRVSGATVLVEPTAELHDPAHVADTLVIADAAWVCERLMHATKASSDGWLTQWSRADAAARATLASVACDGFWEGAIARCVGQAVPADTLLHVASSMPVRDLETFAERVPVVTANRGANGIDGTIATACGAALAWNGPVVVLMGDLAFAHDIGSLITARTLGVNLTLVVVDNAGGGIFDFLPIAAHEPATFARYFSAAQPIDIAALAKAAGFVVEAPTSLDDLQQVLARAGNGLTVIHAVVDRGRNVARHRAASAAIARALEEINEDKKS